MGGRHAIALGLLIGLAGLAGPASASGSTLGLEPVGESNEIFYRAAPGEENDVVASTNGMTVTVEDPGAVISPGNGCIGVSDHQATCSYPGFASVHMLLGNRDDSGRLTGSMVRIVGDGGSGRDRLEGGSLVDQLDGGRDADVLIGRDSTDFVVYPERPDRLRVTLGDGKRNDGGPRDEGLRDRLQQIEGLLGGDGDDVLAGDGAENSIFGGDGRDVVRGKGGEDDVGGMGGGDLVYGGAGADLIPGDEGKDRAFGGKGADHLQSGGPGNGADLVAGGPGHDTAQYDQVRVRLTLDGRANDGPCSDPSCTSSEEGDNLVGIEELLTGFAGDVLIGSRRNEVFHPSLGADTVRARGGDDDVHLTTDGDVDDVDCGSGEDLIIGTPDAFDMNKNCE